MPLKVMKKCMKCIKECKQEVDETVWEGARLIACPRGNEYKKQNKESF